MIFVVNIKMSTADKLCFVEIQEEYEKLFKFSRYYPVAKSKEIDFFIVPKRNKETDINCILPSNFLSVYSYKQGLPEYSNPFYHRNSSAYNYGNKNSDKLYPTKTASQLDDDSYNLLLKFWAEKLENITRILTPTKAKAREDELLYLKIIQDPSFLNEIVISEIIT
jgi:hypothetical protein